MICEDVKNADQSFRVSCLYPVCICTLYTFEARKCTSQCSYTTCTVHYRQHLACFYIYLIETFQVCYIKDKMASPYHQHCPADYKLVD